MKSQTSADIRKRELAQIHVAKTQLGLDDGTYRAMLWTVARVKSAADLDWSGRKKVLDHLKSKGFKIKPGKKSKATRPLASDDQSKMIRGLWLELHDYGYVENPAESALAAFVKRMTGVDALQWLNSIQASKVIEDLKKWLARDGHKIEQMFLMARERGLIDSTIIVDSSEYCLHLTGSAKLTRINAQAVISSLQVLMGAP